MGVPDDPSPPQDVYRLVATEGRRMYAPYLLEPLVRINIIQDLIAWRMSKSKEINVCVLIVDTKASRGFISFMYLLCNILHKMVLGMNAYQVVRLSYKPYLNPTRYV